MKAKGDRYTKEYAEIGNRRNIFFSKEEHAMDLKVKRST